MAHPNPFKIPESSDNEESELYQAVMRSKPLFSSNAEAAQATTLQLEEIADEHDMTVAALIEQAHTTRDSRPHHIEALSLERQLAFLSAR